MIVHASSREGRKGLAVSKWVLEEAKKVKDFDVEFVDLKVLNLPFFDEPEHPKFQKYKNAHTKKWSEMVNNTDAFIFVTSEYNYGMPGILKNATDYLFHEWSYKPLALIGYGGIAAGTRAMQQIKIVSGASKMFVFEGVQIPFFFRQIHNNGVFEPNRVNISQLEATFEELIHLGEGMKALRK